MFASLMMLAFLIDQVQQRCCRLFQLARAKAMQAREFWQRFRNLFLEFTIPDWETLYHVIAYDHKSPLVVHDTS